MPLRLALLLALFLAPTVLPPSASAAPGKHAKATHAKARGKHGKDPRSKFRAGRAPKNKRHDPIPPPPPPPPIKPHGLFRGLCTQDQRWTYEVRVDGRIEDLPAVTLRVVQVDKQRGATLAELALYLGDDALDSLGDKLPAVLVGFDARLRVLEVETDKRHALSFLSALPADPKQLKTALAERPALYDPPAPTPDLWLDGAYTGSQERRVDFPSGIALASCYRWGKLAADGTLDGHELCQDLEHGPVLLSRRAGGHTVELLLADAGAGPLDEVPPPPAEQ